MQLSVGLMKMEMLRNLISFIILLYQLNACEAFSQIISRLEARTTESSVEGVQLDFEDSSSKEMDYIAMCISSEKWCVSIADHETTLMSWYVITDWLDECTGEFNEVKILTSRKSVKTRKNINSVPLHEICGKSGIHENYELNMTEWCVNGASGASVQEIQRILTLLEYCKHLCSKYVNSYTNYTSYSNENQCYDSKYYKFIQVQVENLNKMYSEVETLFIFQRYIEVVILIIITGLGFIMTGTLMFIFIRHKEVRSEPNMIVLNIAFCDLLIITTYPIPYIAVNYFYESKVIVEFYILFALTIPYSSGVSILALSVQRIIIVTGCMQKCCFAKNMKWFRIFIFIFIAWGPVLIFLTSYIFIGIPQLYGHNSIQQPDNSVSLTVLIIASIIMFFLFMFNVICTPLLTTVINCITSCKLRQTARNMPGEIQGTCGSQQQARYRSAKVIYCLCLVFWLTHVPFNVGSGMVSIQENLHDLSSLKFKYWLCALHGLFCSNAVTNPLALIMMSKQFRKLFERYLLKCFWRQSK
ncbi:hypothetical protein C0J52_18249 [Blattella germanica]|nr:hypothetical protein C0J52_18249 [Blattella germanica]